MNKFFALGLVGASALTLNAQFTYHEWNFDDPEGTLLENAANTGDPGTASWNEGLTHTTNGNGQYVIGAGDSSLGFRQADITPYAGILTYVMEIHSWNLDDNETFRNIGMQFRDSVNGSNLINFQVNQEGSGNVRFRISDNVGTNNLVFPGYEELPAVSTTKYTIAIQLDPATGDWEVAVNDNAAVVSGTSVVGDLDIIRFIAGNNPFSTGDDFFSIERLALLSTEDAPVRTWYGYELDADDWTDTGGWLGWINVTNEPYIYSLTLDTWMYASSAQSGETGLWMYFYK